MTTSIQQWMQQKEKSKKVTKSMNVQMVAAILSEMCCSTAQEETFMQNQHIPTDNNLSQGKLNFYGQFYLYRVFLGYCNPHLHALHLKFTSCFFSLMILSCSCQTCRGNFQVGREDFSMWKGYSIFSVQVEALFKEERFSVLVIPPGTMARFTLNQKFLVF